MKREIICPKCEKQLHGTLTKEYPGEHSKITNGNAKMDLMCDQCGQPVYFGDNCFAISLWADDHGTPYFSWEHEYLDVAANQVNVNGGHNG